MQVETPMSEAVSTLDELFSKDPMELTDRDLETIVQTLRAQRALFLKEEQEAKMAGRRKRPTSYTSGIKLSDLDIKL